MTKFGIATGGAEKHISMGHPCPSHRGWAPAAQTFLGPLPTPIWFGL